MQRLRFFLIVMLITGFMLEMGMLIYADVTRIDGSITLKGGLSLLICVPLSGVLMLNSISLLWLIKDEKYY